MNDGETNNQYLLENLKERAKELECLYRVDEVLDDRRLSLPDIFRELTRVIPSGWQFPHICKARIIYENFCYQTPGVYSAFFSESSNIILGDQVVGKVEVIYAVKVDKGPEGFFLEKERKLLKTIADRIGYTILRRNMEMVLREWKTSRPSNGEKSRTSNEWMVMIDFVSRTDPGMLLYVCKQMINHLHRRGVKEAEEVLWDLGSNSRGFLGAGELNYPSEKLTLGNMDSISERTFQIASQHLSDSEITTRLRIWIQEAKDYSLIKVVDNINASVKEIVKVITRYRSITSQSNPHYSPMEHWLVVALIRRFLSGKLEFINVARQHLVIDDFYDVVIRLIFPEGSHGKVGGKSTGLFLAQQIIRKAAEEKPLLQAVKVPKTWYITTDASKEFLHYNNLEELNVQKYKEMFEIRIGYPNIIQILKNSEFPESIIKSLAMALDEFGDSPIIVRSSSLLEDQLGAAFSGKYKSLFLANQGSKRQRLDALMDAIVEVYASIYSPDSIQYRTERGLLDFKEEMGIMIQEVVGNKIGPYYLPLFAGVAFSNNEFRWSPRIEREDGLVRMVMGLGTRAVDRLSDDFPVLISPGRPGLRVNQVPEEVKRYSPKKVDVINLEKNVFETVEIASLVKEYGKFIPEAHRIFSVYQRDHIKKAMAFDMDFERDDLVVTFDGLINDTSFVKTVDLIQRNLREKLGFPVDIEFASDGSNFYLLQCRPQSFGRDNAPAAIPKDIAAQNVIFSARRYIANGIITDISHIVYVDPEEYSRLRELDDLMNVGKAVGMLNFLLPRQRFILMGPGRWGSRGDIKLGVQVSYSDINNTAALIEIAMQRSNYVPDLSFGTHFFQDLVEANIRYLPLYPDDGGVLFNRSFLTRSENILARLLPEFKYLENVVRVIDVPMVADGKILNISMNADLEEALGYLASYSGEGIPGYSEAEDKKAVKSSEPYADDRFWRWRHYMAEKVAARLDAQQFGVKNIYLFGSSNNGTAGPGSDIDLLVHFVGTPEQREELMTWFEGWSMCLAEMNYLKTGYTSEGLLDVHVVTDNDIDQKTSYAAKINAITDPALLLEMKN
ncbi:MAG: pyruvate, phosphate dikinase [Syntrophomonadaceae bacterium]|nr:pyruvate, phosphate dikinase [Syntrophomonadaceae bacterium]